MLPSLSPNAQDGSFDRRVASERGTRRGLGTLTFARLALAALAGAVLLAAASVPLGHAGAAGLTLALALPLVLAAVLAGELARVVLGRTRAVRALARALSDAVIHAQVIAAGGILLVGSYASNLFLVDLPLGRLTTCAYLASAAVAGLAALGIRRIAARADVAARVALIPGWLAG